MSDERRPNVDMVKAAIGALIDRKIIAADAGLGDYIKIWDGVEFALTVALRAAPWRDEEKDKPEPRPWRDRLVPDPEISAQSPVIKGTWITANHVISLIVDGWAWADILKTHPELTLDDIRACVAYSVSESEAPHARTD